jgi:hypothetical protein
LGWCLNAFGSLSAAFALAGILVWFVAPGVIMARALYARQPSRWLAAWLAGPAWGFAASSVVLLALWVAGIRNPLALAFAPALAALAAIPIRRLADRVTAVRLERADLVALFAVLALVPLVDGLPYSRVGQLLPEGRAYRVYFTADFVWAMAVVAEVSKGDVPPRNPFAIGDSLHYYWVGDLLSAIEHRTAPEVALEQILLTNHLLLGVAFTGFFYFFVRHFVRSPAAAALACAAAILFSSFEGAERLFVIWRDGAPLDSLRDLNIDAVSRWFYQGMPVDGLQRLLLYQPRHATAWAIGFSALLVLAQARDPGHAGVNLLAGGLLALGLLISPFLTTMVGAAAAVFQGVRLMRGRRWRAAVVAGLSAAVPIAAAVALSRYLGYTDTSAGSLVDVGVNRTATHRAPVAIALSFGPVLIGAMAGGWFAYRRRDARFGLLAATVAVAWLFYFFVDVRDHQHVYVGWRAGHMLFISFAPLIAYALEEVWSRGRRSRVLTASMGALLALAAAPTTIIDLYNTQDVWNRRPTAAGRWTLILTPDELEALAWIRRSTLPDAIVQVEPTVRDPETWAYIPAFAERRMAAGIPLSMIPLQKYIRRSDRIRETYSDKDSALLEVRARRQGVEYLLVGPPERAAYPDLERILDGAPERFSRVFRNASVSIYRVASRP